MKPLLLELGRAGDVVNILPAVPLLTKRFGRLSVMAARPYSDILEGVGYCDSVPFDGPFEDVPGAIAKAKTLGHDPILVSQVYGKGVNVGRSCSSFAIESWRIIGLEAEFGKHPLVFDRRSPEREKELVKRFTDGKPMILFAGQGHSSPFQHSGHLWAELMTRFGRSHRLVDLSQARAYRFYDLLGLFDAAQVLVTIDTGHMHLARGSKVPVVALVTDSPSMWHGAPTPPAAILSMRYREYPARQGEIWEAIGRLPTPNTQKRLPNRLIHVYSDYEGNGETLRRVRFAKSTWQEEYRKAQWVTVPVKDNQLGRLSGSIGDPNPVPFLKDVMAEAVKVAGPEDRIVFSNSDTAFCHGITEALIAEPGPMAAHRHDFHRLSRMLTPYEALSGTFYPGSDLFCFTRKWWEENREIFPDMLLAREAWDYVLREMVMMKGGGNWFMPMICHEFHQSQWYQPSFKRTNRGQLWNVKLAREWLLRWNRGEHGLP